jgi:hypothetical protein
MSVRDFSLFFLARVRVFRLLRTFHGFLLRDFSFSVLFFYTSAQPGHNMHAACCMRYAKTAKNEDESLRVHSETMALSRNSQVVCVPVCVILLTVQYI